MVTKQIKQKLEDGTEIVVDIGAMAENVETDPNHRFVTDKEKETWGKATAMNYVGGSELSEDATIEDEKAQYAIAPKTAGDSEQVLFSKNLNGLPLGLYSAMFRMKMSEITEDVNLVDIKAKTGSDGRLLKEIYIKPSMFNAADKFQTMGFLVDFDANKGDTLCIDAILLASSSAVTVTIDYVLVAPAYTAVSSLA
ncbi:MAG: hypothetical protein Q4C52_11960 [Eubacteriales bacterium]|nr:hypothetical protein [Eubacteriales bacterium]